MFGEAKEWQGMGRFRLRGLKKVNSEALMIASGQNLKRLVDLGPRVPTKMVAAARWPWRVLSRVGPWVRRQRKTPALPKRHVGENRA